MPKKVKKTSPRHTRSPRKQSGSFHFPTLMVVVVSAVLLGVGITYVAGTYSQQPGVLGANSKAEKSLKSKGKKNTTKVVATPGTEPIEITEILKLLNVEDTEDAIVADDPEEDKAVNEVITDVDSIRNKAPLTN